MANSSSKVHDRVFLKQRTYTRCCLAVVFQMSKSEGWHPLRRRGNLLATSLSWAAEESFLEWESSLEWESFRELGKGHRSCRRVQCSGWPLDFLFLLFSFILFLSTSVFLSLIVSLSIAFLSLSLSPFLSFLSFRCLPITLSSSRTYSYTSVCAINASIYLTVYLSTCLFIYSYV